MKTKTDEERRKKLNVVMHDLCIADHLQARSIAEIGLALTSEPDHYHKLFPNGPKEMSSDAWEMAHAYALKFLEMMHMDMTRSLLLAEHRGLIKDESIPILTNLSKLQSRSFQERLALFCPDMPPKEKNLSSERMQALRKECPPPDPPSLHNFIYLFPQIEMQGIDSELDII